MAHLKEVVDRINLIAYTQQITKAMKMVSASKLHKIQKILLPFKEYAAGCTNILYTALEGMDATNLSYPLLQKKNKDLPKSFLFIVVASNCGLCGAFNKHVLKATYQQIQVLQQKQAAKVEVLTIGAKAYQFFKKSNLTIINDYVDLLTKEDFNAKELIAYCMEAFQKDYYNHILLAYTSFKNVAKQEVIIAPYLPFNFDSMQSTTRQIQQNRYIYEPSQPLLIEKLIGELLKNQIMGMLIESTASEHAARVATMSKATDNAEKLLKELRISYNRTRQSLITSAIAEITGGAEALTET
ncbi:ATP synthase F1 subunit gamma [Cardinium endosymbiont of Culicoides punctatus]|uniref:ATP synthase F1 subunit gamma n=1 Tax=Cardinium endosymbiont of Culicoides punctatus TaxID=2304601 RepID=UPI001058CC0E|nr:ATP synthase F1 subunit gamma [Cardinium endosymbiont of Culicoides punctatus]TDG95365.1 ATP synthase gamma chain, sodium ion specific [Cardinium endosymbiont of Culicoides punctatus]